MVEGACLENRCTATYRGFESLTHRSKPAERWLFASRSGFHPFYPRRFAAAPRGMPIQLRFIGCLHCFDASHLADVPARRRRAFALLKVPGLGAQRRNPSLTVPARRRRAFALLKVPGRSAATKSLTHRSGTAPMCLMRFPSSLYPPARSSSAETIRGKPLSSLSSR